MTTKAEFNADEWSRVVEAPLLAGMRVVGASRGGTIRESMAVARVYAEARQAQGQSDLLDEIVGSPPAVEQVQTADDLSAVVTTRLQQALGTVDEKATQEEAGAYRRFVVSVARAAAEAHKEGGFIGIGGRQISEEEQTALDEIQSVVDAGKA